MPFKDRCVFFGPNFPFTFAFSGGTSVQSTNQKQNRFMFLSWCPVLLCSREEKICSF